MTPEPPPKRELPADPPDNGRSTTPVLAANDCRQYKKARKIKASAKTALRAFHKAATHKTHNQPSAHDKDPPPVEIDSKEDFSNFGLFREYLTDEYFRKGFIHPSGVLELASLFIRCLLSVKRDNQYLSKLRGFHTNSRKFHVQLIAALGWIYSDCYGSALPGNKSRIQTLSALASEASEGDSKYNCAMELVRILLKCAKKTYAITEEEVVDAKIGGWFNNRISQIKKGVWSVDQRIAEGDSEPIEGLYLPFYLVIRAIHPNCSLVAADSLVQITLAEVWQIVLEPRLYAKELNHISAGVEIKLLPRDTNRINYNLWFLYDFLQPEPYWHESMDRYFTHYIPGFADRRIWQAMDRDEREDQGELQGFWAEISELIDESPFPFQNN